MSNNQELKERVQILSEAHKSLYSFTKDIFAKSFTNFIGGDYVEKSCEELQKYDRTMRLAFRSGFKSTSFYSKIMRDIMFRGIKEDLDIRYFSYKEELAGWHISNIKSLIDKNPYFTEIINMKSIAENVAQYTWDRKHIVRLRPVGIVSFTRGLKASSIYCDDILSDPANPIHPTIILKINSIFKSVILESLKPGGELHVIGSPLSQADFYFDPAIQEVFHTTFHPAIQRDNDGNEISAWPEFYSLEQIKKKVFVMGEKAFQAEMMMEPYYSTDSYFKKEQLRKDVVKSKLNNIRLIEGINTSNLVVAGLDIGKKKHPSVLELFEISNGKAIQIHRKVMKGWKYYSGKKFDPLKPTQVEYCKEAIKNFGIGYIYYDNTRGEFEGASDSGLLTIHFVPIVFTPKMRVQMATDFEKAVLNKQLEIFDDEDMLNSICSVTNDLLSIETAIGTHGDEFWAIALALIGFSKFGASGSQDKKIRVGSPSIFDGKIPKGF